MSNSQNIWESIFDKSEDIVHRKIEDETILVPIRGALVDMEKIFSLNALAEYIWEQIDGKKPLLKIRNRVLDTFEVEKDQADADIHDFITDLLEADLIVKVK